MLLCGVMPIPTMLGSRNEGSQDVYPHSPLTDTDEDSVHGKTSSRVAGDLASQDRCKGASGFFNSIATDIQVSDCSKVASANRIDQEARLLQLGDELRR